MLGFYSSVMVLSELAFLDDVIKRKNESKLPVVLNSESQNIPDSRP